MIGKKIVVWFSCGAASAIAAKKTIELYGATNEVLLVNNPIREEHPDNYRFLLDVQRWLNYPIQFATHPKYLTNSAVQVWEDRQYMCGINGAPCTMLLKKEARYLWEIKNKPDYHVLGFTNEEQGRFNRFKLMERENTLPVLIEAGYSKQMCFDEIINAGIKPPIMYQLGYPNANCIGCVKATSATYWNLVRKQHPNVFNERVEQSRRIGAKLVRYKGKRIFLDELPTGVKGRSLKTMQIECGIFCDMTKSI